MKNSGISVLYFLIGLIQIVLQNYNPTFAGFIAKALIIPVLILLLLFNLNHQRNILNWFLLAALLFSWIGDIILEMPASDNLFVPGLVSFLLAHLMYLTVFVKTPGRKYIKASRVWVLLPVLTYGVVLILLLYGHLKEMKIPVIIYTTIILIMLSAAINRKEKVSRKSYRLVLAGAILFVISDSSIAVNNFISPFPFSGILIMSTYITAQFLIVSGYIFQMRQTDTDN
jgi:uncharacterized membrane protein YhhN